VLDILPNRLSSVYTYYNPDFRHMEWGTYTALREIFWAQQVYRTVSPALSWYDMNFYVHQCSRMSYKRHFKPSEILCPKTLRWVPLDACLAKLDADKYAVLAAVAPEEIERQTATRRAQEAAAIDNVLLEVNRGESYFVSGELSVASKATIYPYLQAFVGMVGPRLASRIIVDPSVMLVCAARGVILCRIQGTIFCLVDAFRSILRPKRSERPNKQLWQQKRLLKVRLTRRILRPLASLSSRMDVWCVVLSGDQSMQKPRESTGVSLLRIPEKWTGDPAFFADRISGPRFVTVHRKV
jgi:hypothetical protein